jgi:hypothetical protein
MSGLKAFSDTIGQFIGGLLGFGIGIIPMTYFISQFFSTQDAAIKWNISV